MTKTETGQTFSPIHLKGPLLFVILFLFTVFAGLRIYQLNVRPLHNDESVNAFFLKNLILSNDYRYDPDNYHGPSLYYIQLLPTWINGLIKTGISDFSFDSIAGITDWSIRGVTVGAGLLLLLSLLFTYNRIGPWGALTAFLLLGFSCDMLYFSRYFIHEIFFVLFTLWVYLGSTWYRDSRKPVFFYSLVLSATLVFCTKETSVVTFFVLTFSVVCAEATHFFLSPEKPTSLSVSLDRSFRWFLDGLLNKHVGSLAAAVVVWGLLYSSFFTNAGGLADSVRTYGKWTQEGLESGHSKPFFYFMSKVLVPYELGTVILSLLGLFTAFQKIDKRGLYLAYWTLGMVGAYSIIPYKTIWCVLSLLLPMALLSGYGVQSLVDSLKKRPIQNKFFYAFLIGMGVCALSLCQMKKTWDVTYVNYDKEYFEQPYVHTSRDVFTLIREIEKLAELSKLGKDIGITVVAPIYWPIPYYLRDYPRALFWGKFEDVGDLDAPLLIAAQSQEADLAPLLKEPYLKQEYTLRPNAPVHLYINQKIFKEFFPRPSPIPEIFAATRGTGEEQPGLIRKTFRDRRAEGTPVKIGLDIKSINFTWEDEEEKPFYSPFLIRWEGFVKIPASGRMGFSIESDDGSELWIDDHLVVDNSGTHALGEKSAKINLEKGFHHVRLDFFDAGGEASIRWEWKLPGSEETIVPSTAFFHKEAVHGS